MLLVLLLLIHLVSVCRSIGNGRRVYCTDTPKLIDDSSSHADSWTLSGWCACNKPCPASGSAHATPAAAAAMTPKQALATPLLIISNELRCFERTQAVARVAGFTGEVSHVPASFVSTETVLQRCCPGGYCGKGSRLKPMSRAVMDGGMQAHRVVWKRVASSGVAHVVLEDDVRLLGAPEDIAYALMRCHNFANCSVAYLGAGFDMLLSHAYYVTPVAAAQLLRQSTDWCNKHKQDWVLRSACSKRTAAPRLTCLRPPRGLYVSMQLNWRGVLGWGLFAQDHAAIPSYTVTMAGRQARGMKLTGLNATLVPKRCNVNASFFSARDIA